MCSTRSPPPYLPARDLHGATTMPRCRFVPGFDAGETSTSQTFVSSDAVTAPPNTAGMSHERNNEESDADSPPTRRRTSSQAASAEQCSLSCDDIALVGDDNRCRSVSPYDTDASLSCDSIPILEPGRLSAAEASASSGTTTKIFARRASEHNRFSPQDASSSRLSIALSAASAAASAASIANAARQLPSPLREELPPVDLATITNAGPATTTIGDDGTASPLQTPSRRRAFVRSLSGFSSHGATNGASESYRPDFSSFKLSMNAILGAGGAGSRSASNGANSANSANAADPVMSDPEPVLFLLPDGSARFFCRGARDPLLLVADVMREYPGLHVGVASGTRTSLHLNPDSVILPAPSATYFLHSSQPRPRSGSFSGFSAYNRSAVSWIGAADDSVVPTRAAAAAAGGGTGDADPMRGIEMQLDRFERRLRRFETMAGNVPCGAAAGPAAPSAVGAAGAMAGFESDYDSQLVVAAAAISQPAAAVNTDGTTHGASTNSNTISNNRALARNFAVPLLQADADTGRSGSLTLNALPLPLSPPESPRSASAHPPPRLHLTPATPPPAPMLTSPSSPPLSSRSRTEPRNRNRNRMHGDIRYTYDRDSLTCDSLPVAPSSSSSRSSTGSRHGGSGGSRGSRGSGASAFYPRSSSSPSSSPPTSSPSFSCTTPASSRSTPWQNSSLSAALSRPSSCSSTALSGFPSFGPSSSSSSSTTLTSPLPVSSPLSLKPATNSSPSCAKVNRQHSKSADSSEGSSSSYSKSSYIGDLSGDLSFDVSTSTGRTSSSSSSGNSGSKLWPFCLTPPRTREGEGIRESVGQTHEHTTRKHSHKAPRHNRSRSISFLCGSSSSSGSIHTDTLNFGSGYKAAGQEASLKDASQQRRKPKTSASRSDGEIFNEMLFEDGVSGELVDGDSGDESQDKGHGKGAYMSCGSAFPRSPLWRPSRQQKK